MGCTALTRTRNSDLVPTCALADRLITVRSSGRALHPLAQALRASLAREKALKNGLFPSRGFAPLMWVTPPAGSAPQPCCINSMEKIVSARFSSRGIAQGPHDSGWHGGLAAIKDQRRAQKRDRITGLFSERGNRGPARSAARPLRHPLAWGAPGTA